MTPNFEHHKYLQHIAHDKYPDSYIITNVLIVICRKTSKDLFGGTLKKLILPPEYEVIVGILSIVAVFQFDSINLECVGLLCYRDL